MIADAAIIRRLRACSVDDRDVFVLVAADHRQNLLKQLDASLGADQREALLRQLKVDFGRELGPASTGYLIDPEFGLPACLAAADLDARLPLIVALEKTGYLGDSWDRMPDLVKGFDAATAVAAGAIAAKLLVYFHPDADNAADKEALIRRVADECRTLGLPLFLEPLVYSPRPDRPLDPGSDDFEDAVVRTAERLSRTGPAVLKVQFPGGPLANRAQWVRACRRLDEASIVPWVVLGAAVGFEEFCEQVTTACTSGASGVLVGRTLWGETVHMTPGERSRFLASTGVQRVETLRDLVTATAHSWSARSAERAAGVA